MLKNQRYFLMFTFTNHSRQVGLSSFPHSELQRLTRCRSTLQKHIIAVNQSISTTVLQWNLFLRSAYNRKFWAVKGVVNISLCWYPQTPCVIVFPRGIQVFFCMWHSTTVANPTIYSPPPSRPRISYCKLIRIVLSYLSRMDS